MRVLLLGGTTEASQLAETLYHAGIDSVFSYAGRTEHPVSQPVPTRVGGFGGLNGLGIYLVDNNITHVVDATHPFAAQMSQNAFDACSALAIPITRLERCAWQAQPGDHWTHVPSIQTAVAALPDAPTRVFLAIGRQNLSAFNAKRQHHYLLRLVDQPMQAVPLPHTTVVIARGPFTTNNDADLMKSHAITHVVAKNAGGAGAKAKLSAARRLVLPVIMIDRPELPITHISPDTETVLRWLGHDALRGV